MKKLFLRIADTLGVKDPLVNLLLKKRALKLYGQFIKSGSLVFDVGANVGNRAKLFDELGAKVICVEPQQKCVDILNAIFKNHSNINVIPKGLSNEEGTITLYTSDESSVIATMSDKWKDEGRFAGNTNWNSSKVVEVTTLDNLIEQYGLPDFCKIDVEGFEKNVISGLSKKIPVISFEFTSEFLNDAIDCMSMLQEIGPIEVNYSKGESMLLEYPDFRSMEAVISDIHGSADKLLWGDFYIRFS